MKDASTTGTTGDTALTGTLPLLPDKDSSYVDDMPCRPTPPLRLLLPLQQRRQAERKLAQTPCRRQQTSHRDCDSLRITLVIKTTNHLPEDQPPTLTTDYLARPTKWEPISHSVTSNRSFASTTFMYKQVPSVVPIRCEAAWQPNYIDTSIMEVLYFEFSLYSLFFAIYPKLLNFTFVAFIPQE